MRQGTDKKRAALNIADQKYGLKIKKAGEITGFLKRFKQQTAKH